MTIQSTDLILDIAGFPPYSGRGCSQRLMPIENTIFHRTVNGMLTSINMGKIQKYKTVLRGKDISSPAFDALWVGTQVKVGCIHRLWQRFSKGQSVLTLTRPPVEGSICVVTPSGKSALFTLLGEEVRLAATAKRELFVGFRPWLTMRVSDFHFESDEWGTASAWQLSLEEI